MAHITPLSSLLPLCIVSNLFIYGVLSTNFTMINKCDYTVWPGLFSTDGGRPLSTTGFALQKGETRTITAPTSWVGRMWGRTHCSLNSTGKFSCLTGDCGSGKLECSGKGGAPPATLAEFSLGSSAHRDFYDVSLVDGFNLPVVVVPQGGDGPNCTTSGCLVDLNGVCPSELKVMSADGNRAVGCNSPCSAIQREVYCCSGAYSTPDTCKPSVYSQIFKSACPLAYSYAYDDPTSMFSCFSAPGYTITFCPSSNTSSNGGKCNDCKDSGGSCGSLNNGFTCHCPNLPSNIYASVCAKPSFSPPSSPSPPLSPLPGSGRVLVGALIILSILLISGIARKLIWDEDSSKKQETMGKNQNMDMKTFVRNFGSILPQKFKYSDVKKMTKSFSNKLGQGGYGDVYLGKLADGRLVAVKLLKESKGNGEEFINEVASICRTSHVNIVTLLGFCYTRNKRALLYEFMSNGSLDKFIFDKESSSTNHNLEWKTRYQIAIGIARGLEYLHRGCNTRIVHFDIKPHNILLDENFCPKISDFGLAKLCKQKESVISMMGARGTAGYIAPEVFSRTFGEVSHKSDVYSYGMMVLEMVAGRKNIDAIVSHTSEIYFPNWIYKQLEPGKDFEFDGVVTKEEKDMAKKMIIVSMWCIQTIPSDRPSIGKVLEMFEYSLESLQIPPKPSLSVPARSPKHSIPLSSFSTSTPSHKPASQEEEVCIDLSDN